MTIPTLYRSTDSGAPVLSGTAGSLIAVLDACLVNGYGSKTAAGWSKPFSGTNLAVYRNSLAAGGTGMYARVNDTSTYSATVQTYKAMTDVNTGDNVCPPTAYFASGIHWGKSVSANATSRPWFIVADSKTMYMCVTYFTPATYVGPCFMGFGDIETELPVDEYGYILFGGQQAGNTSSTPAGTACFSMQYTANRATGGSSQYEYCWIARATSQTGSPIPIRCQIPGSITDVMVGSTSAPNITVPSPGGAHEYWIPAQLVDSGTIRGHLRGIYLPLSRVCGLRTEGTIVNNLPGLPVGSAVITARHVSHGSFSTGNDGTTGACFIETALDWAD